MNSTFRIISLATGLVMIGLTCTKTYALDSLEVSNVTWPSIRVGGENGNYTKIENQPILSWSAHVEINTGTGKFIRSWRFTPKTRSVGPVHFPEAAVGIYNNYKEYPLLSAINSVSKNIGHQMEATGPLKSWAITACNNNRTYQKSQGLTDYQIHTKEWSIGVEWWLKDEIDTNIGTFNTTGFGHQEEAKGTSGPGNGVINTDNAQIICQQVQNKAQSEQPLPSGVASGAAMTVRVKSAALLDPGPKTISGDCPIKTSVAALVYANAEGNFQARVEAKGEWSSNWKTYKTTIFDPATGLWKGIVDIPFTMVAQYSASGNTAGAGGAQVFDQNLDLSMGTGSGDSDGASGPGNSVQATNNHGNAHSSIIRVEAKTADAVVATKYVSYTAECNPKKADIPEPDTTQYGVVNNVIDARIEVIPRPNQCGLEVRVGVETDYNNVNVHLALENASGDLSPSQVVKTIQTPSGFIGEFDTFIDLSTSGEGSWNSIGENGVQMGLPSGTNAPDDNRSGSLRIVTSSPNTFVSNTETYNFSCLVINEAMLILPKTEVNPAIVQMGELKATEQPTKKKPVFGAKAAKNKGKYTTPILPKAQPTRTGTKTASNQLAANAADTQARGFIIISPKGSMRKTRNTLKLSLAGDYKLKWKCVEKEGGAPCSIRGLPTKFSGRNKPFSLVKSVRASNWVVQVCLQSNLAHCKASRFEYLPKGYSKSLKSDHSSNESIAARRTEKSVAKKAKPQGSKGASAKLKKVEKRFADIQIRKAEKDTTRNIVKVWLYNKGNTAAKRCVANLRIKRAVGKLRAKSKAITVDSGKTTLVPVKVKSLGAKDQVNIKVQCKNDKNKKNNTLDLL